MAHAHASAAPRPGRIPAPVSRADVYAATRPGRLIARARGDPARVYVPNSESNTVDVVSQRTGRIIDHFAVGALPQHARARRAGAARRPRVAPPGRYSIGHTGILR
ncbi:MAG: hypothetical protein ACJ8J0_11715 [Longimicrobiaceae bacterium]